MGKIAYFTFGGIVLVLLVVAFYHSDPLHKQVVPPCKLRETFGLYCVGCGGTRAVYLLLHARVLESLRYNPLVFPTAAVFSYALGARVLNRTRYFRNRREEGRFTLPELRTHYRNAMLLLVLLCVFMVLRNIPCTPFTWLAPPPN